MAEDMAARWMGGFWNIIAEVQRRIRVAKELKPVRVKVLGDFSHLYLGNGVGFTCHRDRIVEVGAEVPSR
jgi:hypothetical protein